MYINSIKDLQDPLVLALTLEDNELPDTHFINDQIQKRVSGLSMVKIINTVRSVPIELYYGPDDIAELADNLRDDYIYTLKQAYVIISWIESVRNVSHAPITDWAALYAVILEEADK